MARGRYTKKNIWDEMAKLEVYRDGEKLDPGVNYFVFMLDQMGLRTLYSCEGHPGGFYVTFVAPYETALKIKNAGFFSVEIEGENYWSIRRHMPVEDEREVVDAMRWATDSWEKRLGPLDVDSVELVADRKE